MIKDYIALIRLQIGLHSDALKVKTESNWMVRHFLISAMRGGITGKGISAIILMGQNWSSSQIEMGSIHEIKKML